MSSISPFHAFTNYFRWALQDFGMYGVIGSGLVYYTNLVF